MTTKILFLAANPVSTSRIRLDQEIREIAAGLRRAQRRDQFVLEQRWALRPTDLRRAMLDVEPKIVHFSAHGAVDQGVVLEDETGRPALVSTDALKEFFALFSSVECVVLNACYSKPQADAISHHVPYVVGMANKISDRAAIEFSTSFYDALAAGSSIEFAHQLGRAAIQLAGIDEQLTPILIKRVNWVLTLKGEIADLSMTQAEAIIKHLRTLAQDESLKLSSIESGSIILKLEGTEEGFKIIESLYKSGKLTELLGLPVGYVGFERPDITRSKPIDVFFSYSHKDEELRSELVTHLSILERNGVISGWCDRQIIAGEQWENQILDCCVLDGKR